MAWRSRTRDPSGEATGAALPMTAEPWLLALADQLDRTVARLLPVIEDAVGDVVADPSLAGGDELVGRRGARAVSELADELGGLGAALRRGPTA